MSVTTIKDTMNMTHKHYIKQLIQAAELGLNVIIAEIPQIRKSLNGYINHPLIRKILIYHLLIINVCVEYNL